MYSISVSLQVINGVLDQRQRWKSEIDQYVIGGIKIDGVWGLACIGTMIFNMGYVGIVNTTLYILITRRLNGMKKSMTEKTMAMHRQFLRILIIQVGFLKKMLQLVCL